MKGSKLVRLAGGAATLLLAGSAVLGAEFIVKPGQSIQSKIDSASPGDTITIKKGVYGEDLYVNKQLFINGKGAVIDGLESSSHTLYIDGSGGGTIVSGLTFRFHNGDLGSAVQVAMGATGVEFEKCVFKGAESDAVYLDGTTGVLFDRCQFTGNDGGISGWGEVEEDRSIHRRWYAAAVDFDGTIWSHDSTYDLGQGVCITDGGAITLRVEGADLGVANVVVSDTLTVQNSRLTRSRDGMQFGYADGALLSWVEGSRLRESFLDMTNAYGVDVQDCSVKTVGYDAIDIQGNLSTVSGCTVRGAQDGIDLYGSDLTVDGNDVGHCEWGIYVGASGGGGAATIQYNTIQEVPYQGLEVSGHFDPIVAYNVLDGVSGYDDWNGTAGALTIDECDGAAVVFNQIGDVDGGYGILLEDCGYSYAVYNTVRTTVHAGIAATPYMYTYGSGGGGPPALTSALEILPGYYYENYGNAAAYNTVIDCGADQGGAILFSEQEDFFIGFNTVVRAGGVGIYSWASADGTIVGNAVTQSDRDGIWVRVNYGPPVSVTGNTVTASGAEGIQTSTCTPTVVSGNTVYGSGYLNLANNGNIDTVNSTGNKNKAGGSIDPSNWYSVFPSERPWDTCGLE